MRYLTGVVIVIVAGVACSRPPERTMAAAPTSPTAASASSDSMTGLSGGVSGPMDVLFPGRNESLLFRNDLETKYQTGLNRGVSTSFVDREGEVVWTQEYMRYRVNGCDHATASARVMTQVGGGVAGGICAAPAEGAVIFPTRADSLLFRRELETQYQQLGRGLSQSFVDLEGGVIWTQEYLRYRANSCDHATGESKVFTQIDGGAVPATCYVAPCRYIVDPTVIDVGSGSSSGNFEVRPDGTACGWTATSDASWLTISTTGGTNLTVVPYNVAVNNGQSRTGHVTVFWTGGSTRLTVFQFGSPFVAGFTMTDPSRSSGTTTECHFKTASTSCNLAPFANLPGNTYTYSWRATYDYPSQKVVTGAAANFTITDACGGLESNAQGSPAELVVTLTVTDNLGNTVSVTSSGYVVRRFTC